MQLNFVNTPTLWTLTACITKGINSMAINTMDEILKKPLSRYTPLCRFLITKIFIVFYGLVVIGLGFVANGIEGTVAQKIITVVGAFGSPVTGAFLLGAVCRVANKFGAFAGGLVSILVNLWIVIGMHLNGRKIKPLPGPPSDMCFLNATLFSGPTTESSSVDFVTEEVETDRYGFTFFMYDISYVWYSVIGILVTFCVGLIVSLCTTRFVEKKESNPLLIFYVFRQCTARVTTTQMNGVGVETLAYTLNEHSVTDMANKNHTIDSDDVVQIQDSTNL